jgi:hypothetical protein
MTRPRITIRGEHEYTEDDLWTFLRMHAEANRDNEPIAPPPTGGSPCMKHGWRSQPTHPPGASTESGKPKEVRAKLWTTHLTHKATDPAKAWPDS